MAELAAQTEFPLEAEQSHYLVRVLRLSPEVDIEAFTGFGQSFRARLKHDKPKHNCLILLEEYAPVPAPQFRLKLAQALPKSDKLDFILQKSTELGVTDIALLYSERSETNLSGSRLEKRIQHWKKVIRSAAEQSGRHWLPQLLPPQTLAAFMQHEVEELSTTTKIVLDPTGEALPCLSEPRNALILVGPEGGWSKPELAFAANHNFHAYRIGRFVLRTETASLAGLSALQQGWGWK